MSIDEIRTQKALAVLEFQEAEEHVERLAKDVRHLGKEFQSFGAQIERNAVAILENDIEKYAHLRADSAYALVRQLQQAHEQLAEARRKKAEFGR